MHKEYIRHIDGSDTAVLFIHGFMGSPRHFDKFVGMCKDVSVYNLLLHGHGAGVTDFSKASMKMWKEQVSTVVNELCERYENILVVSHSMGTLFSIEEAVKHPGKIKKMMFLQTPLCIRVKSEATKNSLKTLFGKMDGDDEISRAYRLAHSIKLNLKLWQYIGWIPRYLELFDESKKMREVFFLVETPTYVFQSENDELVSPRSLKFIPDKPNIKLAILKNSAHFIYDKEDEKLMLDCFEKMLRE